MLTTLKFVQGAVAKKDFVPSLTHFSIKDGVIKGFNGSIALSSPIDVDLDATPLAVPFVKAIQACKDDTVILSKTPTGRLSVKSGRFKAFVECLDDSSFPTVEPEGDRIELTEDFLPSLKKIHPFIGNDASRPWAMGVLLRGQSAFATNNIVIIELWLGYEFPTPLNIPAATVKELIRIKEPPNAMQVTETSITFFYKGGRWMRSQLYTTEWPDLSGLLGMQCDYKLLPDGLFEAIETIAPFTDESDRIHFSPTTVATTIDPTQGASMDIVDIPPVGCFQAKQLLTLQGVAKAIDFTHYPKPCPFFGENLRGAIIGMRQ